MTRVDDQRKSLTTDRRDDWEQAVTIIWFLVVVVLIVLFLIAGLGWLFTRILVRS